MFIEHWPRICDSANSNEWLYDMVSMQHTACSQESGWYRPARVSAPSRICLDFDHHLSSQRGSILEPTSAGLVSQMAVAALIFFL